MERVQKVTGLTSFVRDLCLCLFIILTSRSSVYYAHVRVYSMHSIMTAPAMVQS